jgi:hypothetical protein
VRSPPFHKPSGVPRGEGGWGVQPPPPKFRSLDKAEPNSSSVKIQPEQPNKKTAFTHFLSCFVKSPHRQLWPPQWYFFSIQGMTWRKHKLPKIKKILPYEMKFLVPNYSCLQNSCLGGNRPQIPVLSVLCPELNLLNPSRKNSWVRHCEEPFFPLIFDMDYS